MLFVSRALVADDAYIVTKYFIASRVVSIECYEYRYESSNGSSYVELYHVSLHRNLVAATNKVTVEGEEQYQKS